MARKGIILAGGSGTRLYPLTASVSKQLLPVYDKPMIYYPLSTLMLAGIREILIITTPRDRQAFMDLLGDGTRFGISISFEVQPSPEGLAQAFVIGRRFVGPDPVCLILGDNIFYGSGLEDLLERASLNTNGATVFAYRVRDPDRYGVISLGDDGRPIQIVEKPKSFISNYAVTGLYFYDNSVLDIAAALLPSPRGELEITDVNQHYLKAGKLVCEVMGRGFAWLDAGTPESLLDSSQFIHAMEKRQGQRIACLEEIALRKGYISADRLAELAEPISQSDYGRYLLQIHAEYIASSRQGR
ncbi:MAG: glucose-1-phosphate thymidylyltransferase RfbA [Alphaproteobacteria bacterium]|nr:glucose-1-phosphate thymidylyltransferase RfbA [Alphaproteobacteria bacterium]